MNRIWNHRQLAKVALATLLSLAAAAHAEGAPPVKARRQVPVREALQLAVKQGPDVAAARAQAAVAEAGVRKEIGRAHV
jgi:outer membrane protein TolC